MGGTQLNTTLDGNSAPLLIKDGLAYATSIGKPTAQDMDTYPHVFFTSSDEWDHAVLDHDPPQLDGLDPSQVPDQLFGDPMFDAYGDFNERIIANLNILLDAPPEDCGSYTEISSVFTANLHQSSPQEPDWNALRPFFAWTFPSSIKVFSEASESYISLTNIKKGIKRDASAYPIFKNERYYNTFIRHFKATAKAQGLNSLMDPNFTPGSDEHEQQLFQEQQDFLYSVLISSLKTEFSEALVKDHEGDAQLIFELLHEHHTGNSQYSRAEINRITKYLTNIKLDDTWRGTNESFLMHYNDQLRLLDSLVDSGEKSPDNARDTFLESAIESVPDL